MPTPSVHDGMGGNGVLSAATGSSSEDARGAAANDGGGADGSTGGTGAPAMDAPSTGAAAVEGPHLEADDRPLVGDSETGGASDLTENENDTSRVPPSPEVIHSDVEAGHEGSELASVHSAAGESIASAKSQAVVSQAGIIPPGDVESQGAPSASEEDFASQAASVGNKDATEAGDATSVRSHAGSVASKQSKGSFASSFLRVSKSNDAAKRFQTNVVDVEQAVRIGRRTSGRDASSSKVASVQEATSLNGSTGHRSCPTTTMVHGGHASPTKGQPAAKSPKPPVALHETMDLSDDEEWDPAGTAGRSHHQRRRSKPAAAGAFWTTKRMYLAAGTVAMILIVLVGLGIGLSKKSHDEAQASHAAMVAEEEAAAARAALLAELQPTTAPSASPSASVAPSIVASTVPSGAPSFPPSDAPSGAPTPSPSSSPSDSPSASPTASPTVSPTTSAPTVSPTASLAPTKPFLPGDLAVPVPSLGIRMSTGLQVRQIARTGQTTQYADGTKSKDRYHAQMDGAGIAKLDSGGYVYMSNSELDSGTGGVYGLYFNDSGEVTDYRPLLTGTTRNCGGGLSPWGTWISCEEFNRGQCWQIDPDPKSVNHASPMETVLGGNGGKYESVAVDNSNPNRPVFFTTEDHAFGAVRRFEASGQGWDALHSTDNTTFLRILGNGRFEWTKDEDAARTSANIYYMNAEGISYHDGMLYFVAKRTQTLLILDLAKGTYKTETTGGRYKGEGGFNAQPDQILLETHKRWIYFTEDGGNPGIYVRDKHTGTYTALFESDGTYQGDETVGIALSPDRRRLYAGYQDAGRLMEFTREDGLPFE